MSWALKPYLSKSKMQSNILEYMTQQSHWHSNQQFCSTHPLVYIMYLPQAMKTRAAQHLVICHNFYHYMLQHRAWVLTIHEESSFLWCSTKHENSTQQNEQYTTNLCILEKVTIQCGRCLPYKNISRFCEWLPECFQKAGNSSAISGHCEN